jgi:hypothetical protein
MLFTFMLQDLTTVTLSHSFLPQEAVQLLLVLTASWAPTTQSILSCKPTGLNSLSLSLTE